MTAGVISVKLPSAKRQRVSLINQHCQVMAWCHQATSHYLSQSWPGLHLTLLKDLESSLCHISPGVFCVIWYSHWVRYGLTMLVHRTVRSYGWSNAAPVPTFTERLMFDLEHSRKQNSGFKHLSQCILLCFIVHSCIRSLVGRLNVWLLFPFLSDFAKNLFISIIHYWW